MPAAKADQLARACWLAAGPMEAGFLRVAWRIAAGPMAIDWEAAQKAAAAGGQEQ